MRLSCKTESTSELEVVLLVNPQAPKPYTLNLNQLKNLRSTHIRPLDPYWFSVCASTGMVAGSDPPPETERSYTLGTAPTVQQSIFGVISGARSSYIVSVIELLQSGGSTQPLRAEGVISVKVSRYLDAHGT